jgi:hypothetical protein
MRQMYENPSTQVLRDMFEKKYSKGAEGEREREDVKRLLESVAVQADDVFADLLWRIVRSSMVPQRAKTDEAARLAAEAEQQAAVGSPARCDSGVDLPAVVDSDDEGEPSFAPGATGADGGDSAGAPDDEEDSGAKHAAFLTSLRSQGLLAALEATLEHHVTAAVRAPLPHAWPMRRPERPSAAHAGG